MQGRAVSGWLVGRAGNELGLAQRSARVTRRAPLLAAATAVALAC